MALTLKPLDETTIDSVRNIVTDRFGPAAFSLLRKLLLNPLRISGDDIGIVACDGDAVEGVTASIVRRFYIRQEPFVGICGGVLAMRRDASPSLLFPLLKKAHRPRFGSVLFYSNTCSPATVKLKPCVGVNNAGPDTWTQVHFARLRRLPLLHRCLSPATCSAARRCFAHDGRSMISVVARSDFAWADEFFTRYLKANAGVVGSRTTAELDWVFGDEIQSGRGLVLVAEEGKVVVGYVVVAPCSYDDGRWMVCDAIAIENNRDVLALLFKAARSAVRRCSSARVLSVTGFPADITNIIAMNFPRSCPAAGNGFMWGFSDAAVGERGAEAMRDGKGWFFGPYDGDFCLCRV